MILSIIFLISANLKKFDSYVVKKNKTSYDLNNKIKNKHCPYLATDLGISCHDCVCLRLYWIVIFKINSDLKIYYNKLFLVFLYKYIKII